MLERKIMKNLRAWRKTKGQECLLIKGARQVGKTYTVRRFGNEDYESFIELNFIENPTLAEIFEGDLNAREIRKRISLMLPGVVFPQNNTLILIDEIQECPNARTALKFLAQDSTIDVIATGSLLGISYKQNEIVSVPVGYEHQLEMYGLDFEEFLWAIGYSEEDVDALRSYLDPLEALPRSTHDKMMGNLREYMAIGGMPAVVQSYVDALNFSEAYNIQQMILSSYLDDIAKYAPNNIRAKARACYLSIPRQLAKENTKFQYGVVEKKGTARKFDTSIEWLEEAHLLRRCRYVSTPTFPLAAYEQDSRFRIYVNDTGLLTAMHGFEMIAAVVNNKLTGSMKGGYYENLVADMLIKAGEQLHYWINNRGDQEIEFLIDKDATVVPIEVKAHHGSTASLNSLLENNEIKIGYKLGDVNVGQSGKKITLPLYLGALLFSSTNRLK